MEEPFPPSSGVVISLESKLKETGCDKADAPAGSKEDPRMKEAMALVESFLAIEDPAARGALIALAQQLVSHDWARRASQRR